MYRCQKRRWLVMVKRRPIVTVAVLGLCAFLSVYVLLGEQNYDKIGIQLLAEKEKILQDIDNKLEKAKPMDERQIFEMDQYERRNRLRMVCNSQDMAGNKGFVNNMIGSPNDFNLTYCIIPRSDNTFWLQVFRYIHHDYHDIQPQSPFHLDVEKVHSRPFVKTRIHAWRMMTDKQRQVLLKTRIVLSVQDPYMRLWTTYLRAVVLPEMWGTVGARIYVMRPKVAAKKGFVCGHDVTFAEFITYVFDSYEKDFAPYYSMCDPCQLQPHYVVKSETAYRDNQYILENLQLAHTVKGENYRDSTMATMINSTIRSSFTAWQNAQRNGCTVNQVTLYLRLWKMFIMEGILPNALAPPPLDDVDQSKLVDLVIMNHRDAVAKGIDMMPQKRNFMVAAYKNLPPALLDSLEERYKMDFKLFSYDSHPHDIFGGV